MTHSAPASLAEATDLIPLTTINTSPDPHPVYQQLREKYGQLVPVELEPGVNAWLVLGYPELLTILRQEQLFSIDPNDWRDYQNKVVPPDSGLGPMMFPRENAWFVNGEKHRRLRAPLDAGIATIDERRMRRSVTDLCARLIDGFAGAGTADLVGDYAAAIPLLAVAGQFGFDLSQGHELRVGLQELFSSGADAQRGNSLFDQLINDLIRDRRGAPGDDLTSFLTRHANLRNDVEVQHSMVLMLAAGYEMTKAWIAQALQLMLTDARFAGRLRGGRLGVEDALDEVLWRDPPGANIPARFALADTTLDGKSIRRGDPLILGFAAANADPRVHGTKPWTEVGNRAHLAWGAGSHACPARIPARLITRTAVETALHLLPGVRLAIPPEQVTHQVTPWIRCPESLPVRFTPRPAATAAAPTSTTPDS
ncbi:cytochrome P450 [Micromonospora sp. NPDC049559]|uniref:cytochrome P450 n=1 Tax=Micromonospora sp. NPDC049559 TaxID=3155923 RepID=UPI003436EE29